MSKKIDDLLVNEENTEAHETEQAQSFETTPEEIVSSTDEQLENVESEAATEESGESEAEEEQESAGFDIPPKFQNKGLEDVVKSYLELEKEYGRRSQELGELRKLTDEIIKKQFAGAPANAESEAAESEEEIEPDDILYEPEKVVSKLVEKNPKLQQIEQELLAAKAQTAQQKLMEKHPDFTEIVTETDFQKWVNESPVRQQLFIQADQQYDFNAADELLTWYKTTKAATKEAATEVRKKAANEAAKKATTETSGGSANKPVFSRKELIKLRIENPRRFEELEPVIMEAYADGRVR